MTGSYAKSELATSLNSHYVKSVLNSCPHPGVVTFESALKYWIFYQSWSHDIKGHRSWLLDKSVNLIMNFYLKHLKSHHYDRLQGDKLKGQSFYQKIRLTNVWCVICFDNNSGWEKSYRIISAYASLLIVRKLILTTNLLGAYIKYSWRKK